MPLYRITTDYFVAGFETKNDIVINAAPIVSWAIGKTLPYVAAWCHKNKHQIQPVELSKLED